MNMDEARAILEKNREAMEKQRKLNQLAEQQLAELGVDDVILFGPRDDIEYARMLRDIKES